MLSIEDTLDGSGTGAYLAQLRLRPGELPLIFIFYYDGLEVVNGLGQARLTHELGCFYWALLPLDQSYRLNSVHLRLATVCYKRAISTLGMNVIIYGRPEQQNDPACHAWGLWMKRLKSGYPFATPEGQTGEVFDITCFTGINQYHILRTLGECDASSLSSAHIRAVDFELACAPDPELEAAQRKADFEKQTRDTAINSITYMASIHLAYAEEPNHERITPNSFACLQCTRENFSRLDNVALDPAADIVTVILDTVTDQRHLHFVKDASSSISQDLFEKVRRPACTACTAPR